MSLSGPDALPIAAVERDTGLSKDTLRVWERRYGFPNPQRDPVGDRAYPPDQVNRLRLIKRLLDAGHRPGKVVPLSMEALQLLAPDTPIRASTTGSATTLDATFALLQAHDVPGLRRQLHQALLALGLERFVTDRVVPLNAAIGEAWLRGEINVAHEHLYTEALQLVLRQAIGGVAEPRADAPRVLLATLPQEPHGLGLLMAEALLSLHGCRCVSLGVKVPLDGIVTAAVDTRSDIVGLSFSGSFPAGPVVAGLADLRRLLPPMMLLWAGGNNPALNRRLPPGVTAVNDIARVPALLDEWRAQFQPPAP